MDDWELEAPAPKAAAGATEVPQATGSEATPAAPRNTADRVAPALQGPSPPASARRPRARLIALAALCLALLLVGALAGYFIARSQLNDSSAELAEAREELAVVERAVAQAEERNWNYYRATQALEAEIEELKGGANGGQPPTTSSTAPGQRASYTEGVYRVGEDILPGDYDGVVTGDVGYWARLRSTDGVIGAIVANGLPRGPFVLTIAQSDVAVELRGVRITSR